MKEGIIYKVTNRANGKCYIGQTVQGLEKRWRQHKGAANSGSSLPIHAAIRAYGFEGFDIEAVAESLEPFLNDLEVMFIHAFQSRSYQHGYNITPGGGGTGSGEAHVRYNTNHSEETIQEYKTARSDPSYREQQAEKMRELWKDPEFRAKREAKRAVKVVSEGEKERRKEAAKKRQANPALNGKISAALKQAYATGDIAQKKAAAFSNPEVRRRMSEASRQRWSDPQMRDKMLTALQGAAKSPEVKAKRSESLRRKWQEPGFREKMSQINSQAGKAAWQRRKAAGHQEKREGYQ